MSKLLLSLLLAVSAASPAAAQQAAPADEDSAQGAIVVQGIRDQKKEIGRFVDALSDMRAFGQLSRFDWAVCPAVIGLGDAQNSTIAARMRRVAEAAAIPVGAADCKANVFLIVAPDKRELIDQLEQKYPAYFQGVPDSEIDRMRRDPSPAAAWHIEGLLDADGVEVPRDQVTGQYVLERTDAPSRLKTMSRPHFIVSVVVVDRDSLAGLSLTQLADYAAMRAFARTDPRRLDKTQAPSILAAIEAPMNSPVPLTLTEWDMAYLKSLYASDPDRYAGRQRSEMKQIVRRDLQKEREKGE